MSPEFEGKNPAELGFRMPAEWERHLGTWFSWPHNRETWPDELEAVEHTMAQAVAALAPHETVHINVLSDDHGAHVGEILGRADVAGHVRLHPIETDDAWIRDHGAIFVIRKGELAATAWGFNSWGGKYPPFDRDDQVPGQMSDILGVPCFDGGMILEGGSIEVNGQGVLLTTEACLLNPNRNPDLTRGEIEARLKAFLGVDQIVWLGDGIAGDDTDGHVDDISRFVGPRTVVTVVEEDPAEANFRPLMDNVDRLRAVRLPDGSHLNVIELPSPAPVALKGERMPASYANFYVANNVVLVPVFGDPMDEVALRILAKCFPGRQAVPLQCRELIWGLGAIHCLSQQVPAPD
jgi:agmatine deiminase